MADPIIIYTDGAASGNPGPGGFGVVLKAGVYRKELMAGFRRTTNNRMELLAVIVGLEALKQPGWQVVVYSDSRYVVDAVEKGLIETVFNQTVKIIPFMDVITVKILFDFGGFFLVRRFRLNLRLSQFFKQVFITF